MKKEIYIFFLMVVSFFSGLANAAEECSAFAKVSKTYTILDKNTPIIELGNMPRVLDQGGVPICYAFSAATIVQRIHCQRNHLDCKNLPRTQEVSPLSMLAWSHTNRGYGVHDMSNHSNLKFFEGGGGLQTLMQAINNNNSTDLLTNANSCYPLDQLADKYGIDRNGINQSKEFESIINNLEVFYNKYRKQVVEGTYCEECAVQEFKMAYKEQLLLNPSTRDIRKSLGLDTFGEFLYRLFINRSPDYIEIEKEIGKPAPVFESYPKVIKNGTDLDDSPRTYESVMNKIKSVLNSGVPLIADGICGIYKNCECQGSHSLVISGYKKMCKPDGTCREVLKVQNSWGEKWQKLYDDGWVDAKWLLIRKTPQDKESNDVNHIKLSWYR